MVKYIKNNHGSVLMVLLVVFAILSLLGTTIMGIGVTNIKMKLINSKANYNLYIAESGVDESYGIIGNLVDYAIKEGNKAVKEFMDQIDLSDEGPYVNSDGTVDYDIIKRDQNKKFKKRYQLCIEKNIKVNVENVSNYKNDDENGVFHIEINNKNIKFHQELLVINLSSEFSKDEISRKIEAKFKIYTPEYDMPYYTKTTVYSLPIEPVWNRTFFVNKDIDIYNGTINIDGNIYINGIENGGINLKGNNIKFQIKGDIITGHNLNIYGTNNIIKIDGDFCGKNLLTKDAINTLSIKGNYNEVSNKNLYIGNQINFDNLDYRKEQNKNDIIFINNDKDITLDINKDFTIKNRDIYGLIITKGDIKISENINYNGAIISDGNVEILGDGTKKFKFDREYVAKGIIKYNLINIFSNNTSDLIDIQLVEDIGEGKLKNVVIRDQLIEMTNWHIIR